MEARIDRVTEQLRRVSPPANSKSHNGSGEPEELFDEGGGDPGEFYDDDLQRLYDAWGDVDSAKISRIRLERWGYCDPALYGLAVTYHRGCRGKPGFLSHGGEGTDLADAGAAYQVPGGPAEGHGPRQTPRDEDEADGEEGEDGEDEDDEEEGNQRGKFLSFP